MWLALVGLAGFVPLALFGARAQNTASQKIDDGTKRMMKSADMAFAMNAAQGGMAEMKLGKLAADKASDAGVKAFGQQMVDDHSKANEDLKSTAEKEGITLPNDLNAKQQAIYSKLDKLSGPAFDRAYVNDMVRDHEEDAKEFRKEANSGRDEQIKAFASRTLPMIQSHLDKIKSIQSKLGS